MINRRGFMKLVAGCASALGLGAAFVDNNAKLVNENKSRELSSRVFYSGRVPFWDPATGQIRYLRYQNGLCCGMED